MQDGPAGIYTQIWWPELNTSSHSGERTNSRELSSDLHSIMACGCPPHPHLQSNEENFRGVRPHRTFVIPRVWTFASCQWQLQRRNCARRDRARLLRSTIPAHYLLWLLLSPTPDSHTPIIFEFCSLGTEILQNILTNQMTRLSQNSQQQAKQCSWDKYPSH